MIQILLASSLIVAEKLTPVVFPVNNYGTVVEARKSNKSYYSLSEDRQHTTFIKIRAQAFGSCNKLAESYQKRNVPPKTITTNKRLLYDFRQNPIQLTILNNPYGVPASPEFRKVVEKIDGYTPKTPPTPIYETTFFFSCHGSWFHIEPGVNN